MARWLAAELDHEFGRIIASVAFAIFRANVERWRIIRKRTLGELEPISIPAVEPANGHPAPTETKSSQASPLFSEVLPGFLKFMEETAGWRGHARQTSGVMEANSAGN